MICIKMAPREKWVGTEQKEERGHTLNCLEYYSICGFHFGSTKIFFGTMKLT
jgi:hypothetical protein